MLKKACRWRSYSAVLNKAELMWKYMGFGETHVGLNVGCEETCTPHFCPHSEWVLRAWVSLFDGGK